MRARLERWLTGLWYEGRRSGWMPVLIGLSRLYGWIQGCRRRTSAFALPVPVLVVGNLTTGGTGKTPLTLALVQALRVRGWHPGILSRGYGGRHSMPTEVTSTSDPEEVGDEPVLMAGRLLAPVWVGRARVAAGQALLLAHPEVDVILCDDGLQHRALMRNVEVVVVDGGRGWGNGRLLPAGPLREPLSRLAQVDAIVVNQGSGSHTPTFFSLEGSYAMGLRASEWVHVQHPERRVPWAYFQGKNCIGVAGIGNPERFFSQLESWGIQVQRYPFPDHHPYRRTDLPADLRNPVLMTEKDAIKWRRLGLDDAWYLPLEALVDTALVDHLATLLISKEPHG
ncbi:tetraacyldisaccharide 4'-kinase [Ferrovum myxofaciens]|uniref:Tetraacyldisaccharide 4'-kinase n=1 Tax=Ferrovum myxofaciens TaxID=416213 RepID=A0A859A5V1_9PROT|nr:tetraacyldisaccharide 4'-kinase [Ferrovum myxofaciens]NDU89791.1 tetraacyldisaccharide 4'-kinase [Ferrovum sp.]KXW58167.1 tetraacyldisaccharide 4'-kinase [Ferrovum myxofaciens]MBU6993575.1 tetraacyldisaccharide 4'-kinase [Ferrovum myxofaciens]QKE37505.1 MAG: tetraacyldisaccharide 4'-kinase [Ferrovum myxofaciens]QKE40070.1 MAG: tetraacyldisaccharide 4'-kinase [Ferrovum myxofaciens]